MKSTTHGAISLSLCTIIGLNGCGVVDAVKTSKTFELVGLAPDEPCVVTAREGRRLAGIYLRQVSATTGNEVFFVTGKLSSDELPKNLKFDDRRIRRIRPGDNGNLQGARASTATPHPGITKPNSWPAVYDLSYRADKIDYAGPIVVGPSPTGFEIPTTGRAMYSGKVELTLATSPEQGVATTTVAKGRFSVDVGYGSARASFAVSGLNTVSGKPLEFVGLRWSSLGLCGTRVTSTGQGQVKLVQSNLSVQTPFQTGREPNPLRAVFESAQFARAERPGAPDAFGGVFVIESAEGTISGVFISE